MREISHYQILGLDESASPSAIREAVDRVITEANRRARVSPAESSELWERIRRIQSDLLSGYKRREAYDLALFGDVPAPPAPALAGYIAGSEVSRGGAAPWDGPRPATRRKVSSVTYAALATIAIALLSTTFFIRIRGHAGRTGQSRVATVALMPVSSSGGIPSGERVTLRWRPVAGALQYRIQISSHGEHGPWTLARTATLHYTAYTVTVLGAQTYGWRVQPYGVEGWTRFSRPASFTVTAPQIGRPSILRAGAQSPNVVRVCWSRVLGAVAYRLRVDHAVPRLLAGTCAPISARLGRHFWQVAAIASGIHRYEGPYAAGFFIVPGRILRPPSVLAIETPRHVPAAVHRLSTVSAAGASGAAGLPPVGPQRVAVVSSPAASQRVHLPLTSTRRTNAGIEIRPVQPARVGVPRAPARRAPPRQSSGSPPPPPPPPQRTAGHPASPAQVAPGGRTGSGVSRSPTKPFSGSLGPPPTGGTQGKNAYLTPTVGPAPPAPSISVSTGSSAKSPAYTGAKGPHRNHPTHPHHRGRP